MKRPRILLIAMLSTALVACSSPSQSVTLTGEEYEQYIKDREKIEKIEYLEESIEKDFLYDVDEDLIEQGIYKGIFESLGDPYSVYYTNDEFEKLMEENQGEFGGIGIVVTAQSSEFITVVAPIDGTPGDRAGIKSGDKIIAINDKVYFGSDLEEAVNLMKGEPGTKVNIVIRRETEDGFEDIDKEIVREIIKVESVREEAIDDDYYYIQLSSFDEHTAEDFKKAIDNAKASYKGAVIDLRNNPGGLLSSVIEISDLLLPKGAIVSTVDKNGKKEVKFSDESLVDIPIVVLVNKGSASASEILSGALQDYGRAKIIGEQTFGKGIVQKIYPLEDGGYKLTVSEYYTAKGNKIHEKGVTPDIEVKLNEDVEGIGLDFIEEDNQLQEAIKILNNN